MPISPNQGPNNGGTVVTITGTNLAGALEVNFNGVAATITANTPTSVTVINPPGSGVNSVTVVTNGGTSNPLSFYYIANPFLTSLSESSGPVAGGNTIEIYGNNLSTATSVQFGANAATPTVITDSQINVVVPAGAAAGSVLVTVTTAGGSTAGLNYVYVDAPTISSVSPSSGSTTGGTSVTITGTGFATLSSATVDGSSSAFGVISDTVAVIITPPGAAGAVDIVMTTNGGSATAVAAFTYISGPGI